MATAHEGMRPALTYNDGLEAAAAFLENNAADYDRLLNRAASTFRWPGHRANKEHMEHIEFMRRTAKYAREQAAQERRLKLE